MLIAAYDWLRAFHILAVIAWMAGLLYLPRLYVYHCEAIPGGELDKTLKLQERRLLKVIMNPAMIVAWLFGLALVWANMERAGGWSIFLQWGWVAKFLLVFAMTGLHHVFSARFKRFEAGTNDWPHTRYRMLNEIPFVFAIAIVLIAVVALA
ncbi:CopD family protein [Maricaulis sp.]|jgi:protoporphyrinogen IX oxidase|uniref:CopD family protein n=1 Tax=Maricaulis sp. TaxID=1486257 RepID=UPI00260BC993|nr:CopD family protein [Maricaulis sp.]MDF1767678.1 CopD family protein [Maricaulis sp.]